MDNRLIVSLLALAVIAALVAIYLGPNPKMSTPTPEPPPLEEPAPTTP